MTIIITPFSVAPEILILMRQYIMYFVHDIKGD